MEKYTKNTEPLCRFGPGGDFTYDWRLEQKEISAPSNILSKTLNSLNEIINSFSALNLDKNTFFETISDIKGTFAHAQTSTHSLSTELVENNSSFSDQPLLFTDDGGISTGAWNKPKYRIRTHCRTAKKRTARNLTGQSSLFENNFENAKSA